MSDQSIEINVTKLLEWLTSRRHCPSNWSVKLENVRGKINQAIQDMPEHEGVKSLLDGSYLTYYKCRELSAILKETEAGSKNIFGRYSSQRMKDWNEIISLYQSEGIYLSETAYLLNRYVNYELPALKKQLDKCIKSREEFTKKKIEYESTSQDQLKRFKRVCESYDIQGSNIKNELLALATTLPVWIDEFFLKSKKILDVISYYEVYVHFVTKSDSFKACETLQRILQSGNITVFEFLYNHPPEKIELASLFSNQPEEANDEIVWDADDDKIDFGIDTDEPIVEDVDVIDFDIEVGDAPTTVGHEAKNSMVARGEEALSVLEHSTYRQMLLTDAHELAAFLHRLQEERGGGQTGGGNHDSSGGSFAILMHHIWSNAPHELANLTDENLKSMTLSVTSFIDELGKPHRNRLFMIRSSPQFLESLTDEVRKCKDESERYYHLSLLMEKRFNESLQEEIEIHKNLKHLQSDFMDLQEKIRQEISKCYRNVPVHFTGASSLF